MSEPQWFVQHVLSRPPQRISCESHKTYYLFLDGACSESNTNVAWSGTSVGAVLANHEGRVIRYFGHVVNESSVKTWETESQVQHVFEAEVLPYALCLTVWGNILRSKCVFNAFIDNKAAKSSWISDFAHPFFSRVRRTPILETSLPEVPSRNSCNLVLNARTWTTM